LAGSRAPLSRQEGLGERSRGSPGCAPILCAQEALRQRGSRSRPPSPTEKRSSEEWRIPGRQIPGEGVRSSEAWRSPPAPRPPALQRTTSGARTRADHKPSPTAASKAARREGRSPAFLCAKKKRSKRRLETKSPEITIAPIVFQTCELARFPARRPKSPPGTTGDIPRAELECNTRRA